MSELMHYLKLAAEKKAADIFIVAGAPISMKLEGGIIKIGETKLFPDDTRELILEIYNTACRSMDDYICSGDDDFSFAVAGLARFRVNTYMQRGSMAAIIRVVAFEIPSFQEMGIPEEVMEIADLSHGMALVTGTAGSGKSTTLACIVDRINHSRNCHIITLEDPIEYLHRNDRSIISQREVSIDTKNFITALRASLRQSPDVIQMGEMRDLETIRAAMTAAETGHLLLGTLHTRGAVNTIDRIVDIFPPEQQDQIRIQLCEVLNTVVSQQLLPAKSGGMMPAFEIMVMNPAVRNLIRDRKTYQIENIIAASGNQGMISMDRYIVKLYREGKITAETALNFATNREQMTRQLQ